MCTDTHAHTHTHARTHTRTCTHTHAHTCTHTHTHTNTHTHTCTHTNTHTTHVAYCTHSIIPPPPFFLPKTTSLSHTYNATHIRRHSDASTADRPNLVPCTPTGPSSTMLCLPSLLTCSSGQQEGSQGGSSPCRHSRVFGVGP